MFWISKVVAPLALAVGIAVTTTVVMADSEGNPPPFGKGLKRKGEDKKADRQSDDKRPEPKKGPPPKIDTTVEAWLKVLLDKITDPHDTIRDSARSAVVAIGPPAIPVLEKLADGDDAAKATAARKLIGAIHRGPGPFGPGFGFGTAQFGPGRPPMGPMEPMRPIRPDNERPGERPKRDE